MVKRGKRFDGKKRVRIGEIKLSFSTKFFPKFNRKHRESIELLKILTITDMLKAFTD